MPETPLALFRCDAGPKIGGGHVMRCLVLADALAEHGWRCGFAVGGESIAAVPALGRAGHAVLALDDGGAGEPAVMARRWPEGCDLLVVDHYGWDAELEGACRPWARMVLAIDDLADRAHDCDCLLDQNLGRRAEDYDGLLPARARLLVGPGYALLRPQFAAARAEALARRRRSDAGPVRILISMGATDPAGATGVALDGVTVSGLDGPVDVVLGLAAPALDNVRRMTAAIGPRARLHTDVRDMAALIAAADLAIGAAGSSSWERCCLGLPTLLVVLADNQTAAAAALSSAGAAASLGSIAEIGPQQIAHRLLQLAPDGAARRRMSERAFALCDGKGTQRVLAEIVAAGGLSSRGAA